MTTTSFRFEVPGQPPSWNAAYRIVTFKKGGRSGLAKTPVCEHYQWIASAIAKRSLPRDFPWVKPQQLRVRYWFRLDHWVDGTNLIKVLEDGVAHGLGIDDRYYLTCIEELSTGHKDPHAIVEVSILPVVESPA